MFYISVNCIRTLPNQCPSSSVDEGPGELVAPSSPSSTPNMSPREAESTSLSGGEDGPSFAPSPPHQTEQESEVTSEMESEEKKALRLLYCSLCKVAVNSASQLEAHNSGEEHLYVPLSDHGSQ